MKVHQREKKKAKFRISFVVLFIFASFAACFTFYMKEDFDVSQAFSQKEEEQQNVVSEMIQQADTVEKAVNPVPESPKAEESYLSDIFFIGHSQMKGLSDYKVIPSENSYFSDDLSINSLNTLSISISSDIKAVYIMVGLKDLDAASVDTLKSYIDSLKEKNLSVCIYLVSLLPLSEKAENEEFSNSKIDAFNAKYLQFANLNGINYLDINTMFVGNDGKMLSSETENDGVRLKREAYLEIGNYILTHIAG